jgi:hypothetical protein
MKNTPKNFPVYCHNVRTECGVLPVLSANEQCSSRRLNVWKSTNFHNSNRSHFTLQVKLNIEMIVEADIS